MKNPLSTIALMVEINIFLQKKLAFAYSLE